MKNLLILGLAVLLSWGCGGSKSSSGPDRQNSLLLGQYAWGQWLINAGPPETSSIAMLLTDMNGAGSYMLDFYPFGAYDVGPDTYAAYADHTVVFSGNPGWGYTSEDGSYFLFANTGTVPYYNMFSVRITAGTGTNLLDGNYAGFQLYEDTPGGLLTTVWMDITANGGAGTLDFTYDDALGNSGSDTAVPYSVTDGLVTFSGGSTAYIESGDEGGLTVDGGVLLLNDYVTNDESIMLAMRKGAGMDESLLDGIYGVLVLGGSYDGATTMYGTFSGRLTLDADGLGGGDISVTGDSSGTLVNESWTYTVAADGALVFTEPNLEGQLSAGGDIFAVVDKNWVVSSDEGVRILLGFRIWP